MSDQRFDETFDFVVIGSGGGGMCAALMMRTLDRSVVVLEKSALFGGTTARSAGLMWVPNNSFMAPNGDNDSYEDASAYLDATSGQSHDAPGASPERRATYLRESPKMVDFLVEHGIKLRLVPDQPDYYSDAPGRSLSGRAVGAELFNTKELPGDWADKLRPSAIPVPANVEELYWLPSLTRGIKGKLMLAKIMSRKIVGKLAGRDYAPGGRALQGRMLQAALNAAVDIRLDAAVTSLVTDNGTVTGVVTVKDGEEWRIGANLGVLVNAGGFAQNASMRERYMPNTRAEWNIAIESDTGDLQLEMIAHGAAIAQMDEAIGFPMARPPQQHSKAGEGVTFGGVAGHMDIAKPHGIIVDQTGVRYMNEGGCYSDFSMNMRKRHHVAPAIPSLWIMDDRYMKTYMFCGVMPGKPRRQEWYDTGWLKKADTLEGLARLCNIDPAVLKATVEEFNVDARDGLDRRFHRGASEYDKWLGDPYAKGNPSLGTIEQGPFYAVEVVPGDVSTLGGVITDINGRVMREDGTPILGLYATGVSTASVFGRYTVGPGMSIGPSFTWGFLAAKHAAGQNW